MHRIASIFAILVAGVSWTHAADGEIFADGFEWGSICTWSNPWFPDVDEDTYGDADSVGESVTCPAPAGLVPNNDDCDDLERLVNPEALEVCDGIDNDCDGIEDDGDPGGGGDCTTGLLGVCSDGTLHCAGGALTCTPDTASSPEICDGLDNDCDGTDDEGDPGGGASCDTGLFGACAAGTEHCIAAVLTCQQVVFSSAEICDGIDNDCDGATDEGDPGGGGSCSTGLPGVCSGGTQHCIAGALTCQQDVEPSLEICDGLDNDCDGAIDEGDPGGGGSCSTGLPGVCSGGTQHCIAGALTCQQDVEPSLEICDGLDNDCDGAVDDGNPDGGGTCNTGLPGVCSSGTQYCVAGDLTCQNDIEPSLEICDGLDNDCDSNTDEGDPGGGASCDTGMLGECSSGTQHCVGGVLTCQNDVEPSLEVCDGLDNDCDGAVDDGNPDGGGSCNTGLPGVCSSGTLYCVAGDLTCQQDVFPTAELCDDALDNDCDGATDCDDGSCVSDPSCQTRPPVINEVRTVSRSGDDLQFVEAPAGTGLGTLDG